MDCLLKIRSPHTALYVLMRLSQICVVTPNISGCKKWDTCAPEAILHAMGGRLTDIHGAEYTYHSGVQHQNMEGVLATARSEDHAQYVLELPQSLKEQVKHSLKKKK